MILNRSRCLRIWLGLMLLLSGCRGLRERSLVRWPGQVEPRELVLAGAEIPSSPAEVRPVSTEPDETVPLRQAVAVQPPPRLRESRRDAIRDLTLPEAIHLALRHSTFIRTRNEFLAPGNPLYTGNTTSRFEPGLQQSEVAGNRGVEAALADFDTQFATNMLWGRNEQVQNNPFVNGLGGGQTLVEDTANFLAQLQKTFATGGQLTLSHRWDYSWNNVPTRLFPSVYEGNVRAEYRHPLWAGHGVEYTRIAGPIGPPGQSAAFAIRQGVEIARINQEISLTDFELAVTRLLQEVEETYWDYYLTYRRLDAERRALEESRHNWHKLEVLQGQPGGGRGVLALARENYYESRQRVENALADLRTTETELRRLIGLEIGDGTVLRPVSEPTTAEYLPDWHLAVAEALNRRPELERQKLRLEQLAFQLQAAKSLTKPRFDFVSSYQVNGFGDRLIDSNDEDGDPAQRYQGAYGALHEGDQTGWTLGFEFSSPIGNRTAHLQVDNLELQLVRERKLLCAQEQEIRYELTGVFQNLDRFYQTTQTAWNQRLASEERIQAATAEEPVRPLSLEGVDLQLRALLSRRDAEIQYYQNLIRYNQALAELQYRQGTALNYYGVTLTEEQDCAVLVEQRIHDTWTQLRESEPPPETDLVSPGELPPDLDLIPPLSEGPLQPAFPAVHPEPAAPDESDFLPPRILETAPRPATAPPRLLPADAEPFRMPIVR